MTKVLTLSLLALGISTTVMAAEYEQPDVGFKAHKVPGKLMKTADFGDLYAVERPVEDNAREIASEDEQKEEQAYDEKPAYWHKKVEGTKSP